MLVLLLTIQGWVVRGQGGNETSGCLAATPLTGSFVQGSTVGGGFIDTLPNCTEYIQNAPGVWYTVTGTGGRMFVDSCDPTTE